VSYSPEITTILRRFEQSFLRERWKIYPSAKRGASLIEDEENQAFYVIFGSDSTYSISLSRLQKTATRFQRYKGKNINRIIYLALGFSSRVLGAVKKNKLEKLCLIKFNASTGDVSPLLETESCFLADEVSAFVSNYLQEYNVKNRRVKVLREAPEDNRFLEVTENVKGSGTEISPWWSGPAIGVVPYSRNEPITVPHASSTFRAFALSDWRVQDISDSVLFLEQNEPVDLVIYAGDDIERFRYEGEGDWFSKLASHTKTGHVLAVVGNDDDYEESKLVLKMQGVCDLYDRSFVFGEYAFIGLESSTSGPAVFSHTESDFQNQLEMQQSKLKGKKLIVVSHTPPHGVLDLGLRFAPKEEGVENIGSTSLRRFIDNNVVEAVVCGHCHSNGGQSREVNSTKIVNVASHDNLGSVGRMAVLTFSESGVDVEWHDTFEVLPQTSVRRVYGVGPVYEQRLIRGRIKTVEQLSKLNDIYSTAELTGLSPGQISTFKLRALSMMRQETYQVAPFDVDDDKVIFVDIETDPACERVWLIGILVDGVFTRLYADTWEQERGILEKFLQILKEHPGYTLISFSGTNFDFRVPLGAISRHDLDSNFFKLFEHVDLCNAMKRSFVFPNRSFALKNLAAYLGYRFKHSDLNGLMVALEYMQHVNTGRELNPTVLEYNEDDVRALPYLIDYCRRMNSRLGNDFKSLI
jgi:Icc-related predicted phosphoesterase/uncharacterized protein YprB with RNaseH-like and TPR domain